MKTQTAVDGFTAYCEAGHLSPKTLAWYRGCFRPLVAHFAALPIRVVEVERLLIEQQRVAGDERLYGYYRAWYALWNFLEKRYTIPNIIKLIKPPRRRPKEPRTLDIVEQAKLIAASGNRRDKAILVLFLDSMIRLSELANLRRSDIKADTIVVHGKDGDREVPVCPETRDLLLSLGAGNYIFMGIRGPLTVEGVKSVVEKTMKAIGLTGKKLGPHTLRHTAATQFIENGGNPLVLQRILGHSTLAMTERYVKLSLRSVKQQHSQYSPLKSLECSMPGLLWAREDHEAVEPVGKVANYV